MTDGTELIDIDPDSPVAPYEQVRARITALARSGALAPHTRLPAVRRLAAAEYARCTRALGVSPERALALVHAALADS